jgi:predicted nuclease with RNAse H fold
MHAKAAAAAAAPSRVPHVMSGSQANAAVSPPQYVGVDVGGARKGFDVAVADDERLVALQGGLRRDEVVALMATTRPRLVGIDSPRACAPEGERSRPDERAFARAGICGIRFTPDEAQVRSGNPYYTWIVEGLALYEALAGFEVVEVFPTASWTRWHGPRAGRSRAAWSAEALSARRLPGVPARTNQDARDAIGAALTARAHARGETDRFGAIVVPTAARG